MKLEKGVGAKDNCLTSSFPALVAGRELDACAAHVKSLGYALRLFHITLFGLCQGFRTVSRVDLLG